MPFQKFHENNEFYVRVFTDTSHHKQLSHEFNRKIRDEFAKSYLRVIWTFRALSLETERTVCCHINKACCISYQCVLVF